MLKGLEDDSELSDSSKTTTESGSDTDSDESRSSSESRTHRVRISRKFANTKVVLRRIKKQSGKRSKPAAMVGVELISSVFNTVAMRVRMNPNLLIKSKKSCINGT